MQLALREVHQAYADPRFLIGLVVVALINLGFLSGNPFLWPQIGALFGYCLAISLAVGVMHELLARPEPAARPDTRRPAILDRLPLEVRGRLSHISVADHYVDVVTDKGHALVLMRLSDAIRETGDTPGLQVHRSHWVAIKAVERVERRGGKVVVVMASGTELPLSRSYVPTAKAAGLLV